MVKHFAGTLCSHKETTFNIFWLRPWYYTTVSTDNGNTGTEIDEEAVPLDESLSKYDGTAEQRNGIPYFPGYKSHWSVSCTLLFETKLS